MAHRRPNRFHPRRVYGIYRPPDHEGAEYAAGWRDGYEAGRRSASRTETRTVTENSKFEGASIILLLDPEVSRRGLQAAVRHLEGITPYPYEILIAGRGAEEAVEAYAGRRAGAVRHIRSEPAGGAGQAINRAVQAAWGQTLILLSCGAFPQEGWLKAVVSELRKNGKTGAVYCRAQELSEKIGLKAAAKKDSMIPGDHPDPVHLLAFTRKAWDAAGEWREEDLAGGNAAWIERLTLAGFRPVEADGILG